MKDLHFLVYEMVRRAKDSRSCVHLHNILTGYRSMQTIYDSKAYNLVGCFGLLPKLSIEELQHVLDELVAAGHVASQQDKNTHYLYRAPMDMPQRMHMKQWLDRAEWIHTVMMFRQRLQLCVQMMSNKQYEQSSYTPMVQQLRIKQWGREFYRTQLCDQSEAVHAFYTELVKVLSIFDDETCSFFVNQLSGFGQSAKTVQQFEVMLNKSPLEIVCSTYELFAKMMIHIVQQRSQFPTLLLLIPRGADCLLTLAARSTYEMLQQGSSIEDICNKRRVKESTVGDHLFEICATMPHFNVEQWLSDSKRERIQTVITQHPSRKLGQLMRSIAEREELTYLELRLTVAKIRGGSA
ncbi:MAG: helix-turn-helix domain-containing protein [Bacilli bacterium]